MVTDMRQMIHFAASFLALTAVMGAAPFFQATISDAAYHEDRSMWIRTVSILGPDGMREIEIPGMDVVTSVVLGNKGVLAIAGEWYGDGMVGFINYHAPETGFNWLSHREWYIPEAYPEGITPHPSLPPTLTGWNEQGKLTGLLWAEWMSEHRTNYLESLVPIPYTWEVDMHLIANPEPGTFAFLAGGLALLGAAALRRRR
jgi:hypothetical protein